MSEARDLNDSSSPDSGGSEMEQLLRSLVPRPLSIDRDVLFFQAGIAAAGRKGGHGRVARIVWPAIAATLLVACGGLVVALQRESKTLEAVLAATASRPTGAIASESKGLGLKAVDPAREKMASGVSIASVESKRFGLLTNADRVEQVLSLARRPRSQLSMHGWIEAPPGSPAWEVESTPADALKSPPGPIQRPTYLELIRAEQG